MALLGHSMGATIAPLVVAAAPEFRRVVLSGAGGSYLANLVYKQSPLEVRPLAEALLGFGERGRRLEEADAVLQLLQWASEPADPPPYARRAAADVEVLMVQGIVDTYILPPMANAMSVSWGLDLAGPALDADEPRLAGMRPLGDVLAFGGGEAVALPASGRVVVQVAEDGVEDGHEALFQTDVGHRAYRCFLEGGVVPATSDDPLAPCP
jgi:pimeloyl-ACP methyl ester carboxylesterase